MPDFAAIGDNCIDCYLPPVDDCMVGGNAVNVAVQLSRRGRRSHYFGAVGADAAGAAVRDVLAAQGVDVAGLHPVRGQATARTDIETLPGGERRFAHESFGACIDYRPDESDLRRLRAMSHIHIGWLRGAATLRAALQGAGVVLSQNLSVNNREEDLDPAGLDIAFLSAPPEQAESESQRVLARGARLAVVTMGAAGSLAARPGQPMLRMASLPVPVVDTTGAGDAFIAGFLDAYGKALNLKDCLARATEAGAAACGHRGGFPQAMLQPIVHDSRL